ncbi:MAG: UDP-N-acetylglucosamine 1-carboxyvinyltransferase [Chloroflexi bacterium]|nr:UDP-N-acetylglucosamine 1-carboxyvinyltransferase [Chloroflexota bacterium]
MAYYEIEGGAPLRGHIRASGAKNAITKELVASLLTSEECVFENVPRMGETQVTLDMLESLGSHYTWEDENTVRIQTPELTATEVPLAFSGINRVPILLLGPMLHRAGEAAIPMLGGCNIGPRPVDFHIDALTRLGAEVQSEAERFVARASQLHGTVIDLPFPSVGATENILLSSSMAKGTTVIHNAAIEPEVIDLIVVLQKMGAIISVDVDRTIIIEGVDQLSGLRHRTLTDRIEVASFAIAAILTGGDVFISGAQQIHMMTFLNKLRQAGGGFEVNHEGIRFFNTGKSLRPMALETDVHPGFMTDWQQPFLILMTQADGLSVLHETVYEKRFGYVSELKRMGAQVELYRQCLGGKTCRFVHRNFYHSAVIKGPTPLKAADITIPDLRAGFTYLIAACIADGVSKIDGIRYINRGYSQIREKFEELGAQIREVGGEPEWESEEEIILA